MLTTPCMEGYLLLVYPNPTLVTLPYPSFSNMPDGSTPPPLRYFWAYYIATSSIFIVMVTGIGN